MTTVANLHPAARRHPLTALWIALFAATACANGKDGVAESPALGGDTGTFDVATDVATDVGTDAAPDQTEWRGAGVTADDVARFGKPAGSEAPFVFDPSPDALLPRGWPSPSFLVRTASAPSLVRLEWTSGATTYAYTARAVSAPSIKDPSGVSGEWWNVTMPAEVFDAHVRTLGATTLTYRISFLYDGDEAPRGVTSGKLRLLENGFEPDMTYWEIRGDSQFSIQRLLIGAKETQTVIPVPTTGCIGCHTSSPDGKDVAYQEMGAGFHVRVVRPKLGGAPVPSPVVSPAASAVLTEVPLMVPTTSPGAWSDERGRWLAVIGAPAPGESRLALLRLDAADAKLQWAFGPDVDRVPDGLGDALPAWSPDGKEIIVVRTDRAFDGRTGEAAFAPKTCDLVRIPVTIDKLGVATFGAPTGVPFASGTPELETYPTYSSDGRLIAYSRAPAGRGAYDEEQSEVFVIKADGSGKPVRLAANEAPASASVYAGTGLTNSWPRFGETTIKGSDGSVYYPVVFNSRRGPLGLWEDRARGLGRPLPRLTFSLVRVTPSGEIESSPGALVPGQRVDAGAHTASFRAVTSLPPPPIK